MSVNQLRPEKNTFIYRKSGSGKSNQSSGHHFRPVAVGTGSVSGPFSEHSSFKKSNNAQGGQSKGNFGPVNTPTNLNSSSVGAHSSGNGDHPHPTLHGVSQKGVGIADPKTSDTSSEKSQPNSKSPSFHSSSVMTSATTSPSTPAKGDPGKGFSLQFGSLSPGIVNGPVVPPRISSAPPNLDEQKRKQAQIDGIQATTSSPPVPPASKQHGISSTDQPLTQGTHKSNSPPKSAPPPIAVPSQRPPILHTTGISMPMPFHNPNIPVQFGGPTPQIQSNSSLQQPATVYMPALQHQLIRTGHGLGFGPSLGHPVPPHHVGVNLSNLSHQFSQPQSGKFASARKTVKITHPETHEELRLDKGEHIRPQPSQAVPSYYPNLYGPGPPPFFPAPNLVPPANAQLPSCPQAPRFGYPINQSFSTMPVMKHSSPRDFSGAGKVESHKLSRIVLQSDVAKNLEVVADDSSPRQPALQSVATVEMRKEKENEGDCAIQDSGDHSKARDGSGNTPLGVGNVEPVSVKDSTISIMAQEHGEKETIGVGSTTSPHNGDKTVSPSACRLATFDSGSMSNSTVVSITKDGLSRNGAAPTSSNRLETNPGQDGEDMENSRSNPSLHSNKTLMDNTKNNKSKKKRKEMLQKADAQDTSSDLYMAYKGPEKKEAGPRSEDSLDHNLKNPTVEGRPANSSMKKNYKPDIEDWENAADISVTEESGCSYNDDLGVDKKRKYSRDFLLTFSEQYTDFPEGFEVTFDIADVIIHTNTGTTRGYREHPSTGKIADRPSAAIRIDRRGNGVMMDGDRLGKLQGGHPLGRVMGFRPGPGPNFGGRGPGPVQYLGGILSEPMYSFGPQRNKPDDRWQRGANFNRGSMMMSSSQAPLQAMHKAESKYEVGRVTDEEQAKQRRLKAILNKLTPQNFEKLFEQVQEVKIDNAVTLTGVISQIFDKALMEPTFCEMYANFCYHLASELPDLSVDNEKITFKRLLLNKCQEEFERGEREEEEANKVDGEGDTEEKRLKVRRRMLGNIRLIGELYKKRMLTERIMHECIKKLLGQYHNPDEENIEALCKLMSTIGEMIDHPKAKEHMDAYFDIMGQLSNDMKLSSRVRFMLRDSIDLRKNKWHERRKVEGPKKIEEVHRDVAKERLWQAGRSSRGGPSSGLAARRGPPPVEYGSRGGSMAQGGPTGGFKGCPPPQGRTLLSVPLLHKTTTPGNEAITLGPQGGLARGMSFRGQVSVTSAPPSDTSSFKTVGGSNGYTSASNRVDYEKSDVSTDYEQPSGQNRRSNYTNRVSEDLDKVLGASSGQSRFSEEQLRDMSIAAIREYYSAKDEKEVALCIKDLNAPSFYPTVVSIWVTDAFERKDKERDMLAQLLVDLAKPREGIFSRDQLIEGFESVLTNLEDTVTDAPRAPEFLGHILGKVISENILPLKDVGGSIHKGGEEPGRLVEVGLAAEVLGNIFEMIRSHKGESTLNEMRLSSNLRLEDFRPCGSNRSKKLEMFIM